MSHWQLQIETVDGQALSVSYDDLERWKDATIPVEEYVPGKQAEAVYVKDILRQHALLEGFSRAVFTAEDGFKQKASKEELDQAFFVFKQNGEPMNAGARLYVPDGRSDCLNVKSVIQIQLEQA
ncbi:hypothetical protein BEP19_00075 [Ammoniphilus oxalaticus]|uniref:Uncharacterized protein n=1 Tax=Ammoniphilus oxalaticus TaxID=66863 RepID=A0A419SR80_9BACL|nr:hypothetical protein [Ammoniphilus oxalaticus]RKD27009.1 hypothetical protein BEP19_00075 [Ammoniphilus oxalaticus]